jgi:UDP-N-acetylglucosamine:LPS N-acetylglucosamine transferase
MNILTIPSWYSDKNNKTAGIFTKELVEDMSKHVNVAVYYPFDDTLNVNFQVSEEAGIKVYRSSMKKPVVPKTGFAYNIVRYIFQFKKILKDFKPDIIHAHVSCPAGYIASFLGKYYKIPVVITEHNPVHFLINGKTQLKRVKQAIEYAKYTVCVSHTLKNDLKKYNFNGNYKVIYNGVGINSLLFLKVTY